MALAPLAAPARDPPKRYRRMLLYHHGQARNDVEILYTSTLSPRSPLPWYHIAVLLHVCLGAGLGTYPSVHPSGDGGRWLQQTTGNTDDVR
jgi:hypothetical protein